MSWQDYLLFRQLPHTRQLRSYNAFASEPRILFSLKDIISSHNLDKKINKSILTVILENTDATVKFQHYEINSRKQLSAEKQQIPQMKFIWTSVLKFKTLFPVLQNFYELLSPGWGLFGLLFSFITLTFFFFYRIVVKVKSSHLHFSSLKNLRYQTSTFFSSILVQLIEAVPVS